jgi:hypothetical protein
MTFGELASPEAKRDAGGQEAQACVRKRKPPGRWQCELKGRWEREQRENDNCRPIFWPRDPKNPKLGLSRA